MLVPRLIKLLTLAAATGIGLALALQLLYFHTLAVPAENPEIWHLRRSGDFPNIYAAGEFALSNQVLDVYTSEKIMKRSTELTDRVSYFHLPYPPTALVFFGPFSVFSPVVAYVIWIGVWAALLGLACYLATQRASSILFALTYSGAVFSANCGQNGTLSATLVALGVVLFDRSPVLSGVAFGLLTYKPHLAWVPIILAAVLKRLDLLVIIAATILGFCGLSLLLFGPEVWVAFIREGLLQSSDLESGRLRTHQVTPFALMRTLTDNVIICYVGAIIVACLAMRWLLQVWFGTQDLLMRSLALAATIPLATPYGNDYDLAILGLPYVLACQHVLEGRIGIWKGAALIAVLSLLPVAAFFIGGQSNIPQPTSIILLMLLYAVRCAVRGNAQGAEARQPT